MCGVCGVCGVCDMCVGRMGIGVRWRERGETMWTVDPLLGGGVRRVFSGYLGRYSCTVVHSCTTVQVVRTLRYGCDVAKSDGEKGEGGSGGSVGRGGRQEMEADLRELQVI